MAYTVLQTAGPVAGFFVSLALVQLLPPTAATVLAGYAAAQIASLVFAGLRLRFSLRVLEGSWDIVRQAVPYGLPLFFGGLLVWVANNGVRFLIEWQGGVESVGLVTVGWALGSRAAQFASMLTTAAAFPLAVRRSRTEGMAAGQAQLIDNGVLLLAVLAPALAGMCVIGPPLIALIVAAPYREVTTLVLPLALITGAARAMRVHFANQVFLLHERPLIPTLNDGIDALLTMLFGGLGLWLGGVPGCVAGVMAGSVATLATGLALSRHWYQFTFPLSDLCRIGTATALMAATVSLFHAQPTGWSIANAMIIGAVVYGAGLAAGYPLRAWSAAKLVARSVAMAWSRTDVTPLSRRLRLPHSLSRRLRLPPWAISTRLAGKPKPEAGKP